jgi:FkbM family methyltransferase
VTAQGELGFDRLTGTFAGASAREQVARLAFQAGAKLSSAWSHRGFAAGCRALRSMLIERDITVRLNEDALFAFPYGDGYWTLLLDRKYRYEADIELFFAGIADAEYTLIDGGANYGYWSVLATSKPFGAHRAIAIEPSSKSFAGLAYNAKINGNRFKPLRCAIAETPGHVTLSGSKHEALSIVPAAGKVGEEVEAISLDGLIDRHLITALGRYVIKLDVEGVEVAAMRGGERLLKSDCVLICEDHGSDRTHAVSRHILSNTRLKLFCFDRATGHFEHLRDVTALNRIKQHTNVGYNVLATASGFWESRIRALVAEPGH